MQLAYSYRRSFSALLILLFVLPQGIQIGHRIAEAMEPHRICTPEAGSEHLHDPELFHWHHCFTCTFAYSAFTILPPAGVEARTFFHTDETLPDFRAALTGTALLQTFLRGPPLG